MQTASTLAVALLLLAAAVSENACRQGRRDQGTRQADAAAGEPAPAATPGDVAAAEPNGPFAEVPRVGVEELKSALGEGRAVVVDVRPAEAFAAEHIAGAISIPEEEVPGRAGELPPGKLVVTYCA